jgi:hypothetical protein
MGCNETVRCAEELPFGVLKLFEIVPVPAGGFFLDFGIFLTLSHILHKAIRGRISAGYHILQTNQDIYLYPCQSLLGFLLVKNLHSGLI